jgi:hypothetical protein
MALLKGNATQVSVDVTATISRDGADQDVAFTVFYKLRARDEQLRHAEHIDAIDVAAGIERASARIERAKDLLRSLVLGWHGLTGSDGEEIQFSPEVLDEMLALDDYYDALMEGLRDSSLPGARRKN